jgi:hypothetical protein
MCARNFLRQDDDLLPWNPSAAQLFDRPLDKERVPLSLGVPSCWCIVSGQDDFWSDPAEEKIRRVPTPFFVITRTAEDHDRVCILHLVSNNKKSRR